MSFERNTELKIKNTRYYIHVHKIGSFLSLVFIFHQASFTFRGDLCILDSCHLHLTSSSNICISKKMLVTIELLHFISTQSPTLNEDFDTTIDTGVINIS